MSLGAKAKVSRPRGPAKFKDINRRREAILGKWRDGRRERKSARNRTRVLCASVIVCMCVC